MPEVLSIPCKNRIAKHETDCAQISLPACNILQSFHSILFKQRKEESDRDVISALMAFFLAKKVPVSQSFKSENHSVCMILVVKCCSMNLLSHLITIFLHSIFASKSPKPLKNSLSVTSMKRHFSRALFPARAEGGYFSLTCEKTHRFIQ